MNNYFVAFFSLLSLPLLANPEAEKGKEKTYIISRHNGIVGVAQIGNTAEDIKRRGWLTEPVRELASNHALKKMHFSKTGAIPELGIRLYFKNQRVALIEIQDPFKGTVQGSHLEVFRLASIKPDRWGDEILRQLGSNTKARAGNGKFGSEAIFYEWGDISYNANGPNEIAIYRDPEIANYRQTNFGRKLDMWN